MLQVVQNSIRAGALAALLVPMVDAAAPCQPVAAEPTRAVETAIAEAFEAGKLKKLHAVLVLLGDETLAELYFEGGDEHRGRTLGVVQHGPETLHDIRSITKSVVALLYGIALAPGKVPEPGAPLLAQFPDYGDLAGDPLRDSITIADALTMRMGTEWNENLPYADPRNSEIAMEDAPDSDRYVLDRKMLTAPGKRWSYSGGAAALVAKLIADGTGMSVDEFARIHLFEPLGITRWHWATRPDGTPSAASGLRLTARDLGKIGRMILSGGTFGGREVVPKSWLDALFTPRVQHEGIRYGYYWWLADGVAPRAWVSGLGHPLPEAGAWSAWVAGIGNGGQRLSLQPDIGLVVVTFAGDYNNPDDWVMPVRIIEEYVTPELRRRFGG